MYINSMKHAHLVLDERLLEEAVRLGGERTYSKTVARALTDFVRRIKARRILELAGSGLWDGDLPTLRRDPPKPPTKRRTRRPARGAR